MPWFEYVVGARELLNMCNAVVPIWSVPKSLRSRVFMVAVHGACASGFRSLDRTGREGIGGWLVIARRSVKLGLAVRSVLPLAPLRVCSQAGVAVEKPRCSILVV
jgi:hypothetical protein